MTSRSFIFLFSQAVERYPNKIAIVSGKSSITYQHLYWRCLAIAAHINANTQNIGVYTSSEIDSYATIIAIIMANKTYVPLNSKNTRERNLEIIAQAEISQVFSVGADPDFGKGVQVVNTTELTNNNRLSCFSTDYDGTRTCYLLFTSGSTGKPKGVPIFEKNVSAFLHRMLHTEGYQFCKEDKFLQPFELSFDLSVFSYMVPLCIGASFHVVGSEKIFYLGIIEILERDEITVALMVPSVINYLEPYFDEINLPALRLSLFCGEALYASKTVQWAKCLPNGRIENVYGPTEATIFFTRYAWCNESIAESVNDIVPIGKPMTGLSIEIAAPVNEDGNAGEVILIGDQVTTGYYNDLSKSAEVFSPRSEEYAYRTGDVGYFNENGDVIFCGRKDSQVKINGYRIELSEVEFLAKKVIVHNNVVALTRQSDKSGLQIVLFIEEKNDPIDASLGDIRSQLSVLLPYYMMPQELIKVPVFPYNLSGKIDRSKLKYLLNEQ